MNVAIETISGSTAQPIELPQLKVRRLPIDTHPDNTAFLLRSCAAYRPEQFRALRTIELRHNGASILASLAITDDPKLVAEDEVGLSEPAFRRLCLTEGDLVRVAQAKPPRSLDAVRRKIGGDTLTSDELAAIIADVAAHRYSPMELSAFLVACAGFMTTDETLSLTQAMAAVGNRLRWGSKLVVDKHCIGGIPGNRTSMIVAPIVAAHGLIMPKTSSRSITSPAGTADTMEVLADVDLPTSRMRDVVERANACLVWGGRMQLSPADDVLISVERPLRVDTFEQMVASILSKKLSAGSTHLVLDIPVGPTAKVRSQTDAVRLRKLFEYVGRKVGLVVDAVFTDGSQPVGRGIGPVLEARDVMAVLRNDADAPADLRERALFLAGRVLDFAPDLSGGCGYARAAELLTSGQALAAMDRIIDAQGRRKPVSLGTFTYDVRAQATGTVSAIDCHRIARIARLAGAPMDQGSGIDLFKKIGATVVKGEPLYRIYACATAEFDFAVAEAGESNGYSMAG